MNIHHYHIQPPSIEIQTIKLGIPQEYKQECIDEAYRLGDSMNQTTNVKAIMSDYTLWKDTKLFDKLLNNIISVINVLVPINSSNHNYSLEDAWFAIYKKDHYTLPHNHLPSHVSFVYYLKSTGATPLIFDGCDFKITPTDDMLVIFPSYISHSVPKHTEEEDRICLAGNLKWEEKQTV